MAAGMRGVSDTSFLVRVTRPLSAVRDLGRTTDQDAAVEMAREAIGPRSTLVTIEASRLGWLSTFALKHVEWRDDGSVQESDWRTWIDGQFVGGRERCGWGQA